MSYLAFAGYNYYPIGGLSDLIGTYDTLKEAQKALKRAKIEHSYEWFQCYDTETRKRLF